MTRTRRVTCALLIAAATSSGLAACGGGGTKAQSTGAQLAELKASDTVKGDHFGSAVAISGTTVVVGAALHAGAGRAYVFTKTAAGWRQNAELAGSGTAEGDSFGASVAVSGTTLVIGGDGHALGAGRAYVFTKTPGGWRQAAELVGADTVAGDNFGSSVAIAGATIVVGAAGHARQTGRAYVFAKTPTGWRQAAELVGSGSVIGDNFGNSVAIAGATIAVGAVGYALGTGRAYVFTETPTGPIDSAGNAFLLGSFLREVTGRSMLHLRRG